MRHLDETLTRCRLVGSLRRSPFGLHPDDRCIGRSLAFAHLRLSPVDTLADGREGFREAKRPGKGRGELDSHPLTPCPP